MNRNFNSCVKEAKKIVGILRLNNLHRMKIAELAVKACTIKHGGRNRYDRLTVKVFAEKVGINPKTLHEWIRHKRFIFDKLTKPQLVEFKELPAQDLKDIITGLKEESIKAEVRQRFKEVVQRPRGDTRIKKYFKAITSLKYNVMNHARSSDISDDSLLLIMKECREVCTYIGQEMKVRRKEIPVEVNKPKVNFDEFWDMEVQEIEL